MPKPLRFGPLAAAFMSVALAACVVLPAGPAAAPAGQAAAPAGQAANGSPARPGQARLAGRVLAPPGLVAAGGGNVIVNNTGNIVGNAGGSVIGPNGAALAPRRGVLAIDERPLAGAEVFLADSAGDPLPGRAPVTTAADGSFTFPDAPADLTVLVAARTRTADGRPAVLQTIARPTAQGTTADVSGASTMVAAALVAERSDALDRFDPATFATATDVTARNLSAADLPDFADRAAVVRRMNELAARIAEIRTALAEMRAELEEIKATIADLEALIAGMSGRRGAAGSPPPGGSPGPGPGGPDGSEPTCEQIFGQLDADADGGVTLAEWTAEFRGQPGDPPAAEVFGFVDADRDGRVVATELVPACEEHRRREPPPDRATPGPGGTAPPPDPRDGPSCEDLFAHFDANRDGRITEVEWRDVPPGPDGNKPPPDHFGRLDGNRDGIVDRREIAPMCSP